MRDCSVEGVSDTPHRTLGQMSNKLNKEKNDEDYEMLFKLSGLSATICGLLLDLGVMYTGNWS